MFNLFSKKSKQIVTHEDKLWVEANLEWMFREFGEANFLKKPVSILESPFDKYPGKIGENVDYFLSLVCSRLQIEPKLVNLEFYQGDGNPFDNSGGVLIEKNGSKPLGLYHHQNKITGKFDISLSTDLLEDIQVFISTLAHELCHLRLLGEHRIIVDNAEANEHMTDLASIYFGFGVLIANTCTYQKTWTSGNHSGWSIGKLGYLPQQIVVHALAVQAYLTDTGIPHWHKDLDRIPRKMFLQALNHLRETKQCDTSITIVSGNRRSDV